MTVPNLLSIGRIALIPLFVVLVVQGHFLIAFTVFACSAATDVIDGQVARRFAQQTRLGAFLDPVADKLLLTSSFVLLSLPLPDLTERIPLWLLSLVLARDAVISAGVLFLHRFARISGFQPSVFGKAHTLAETVTIGLVVLANAEAQLQADIIAIPFFVATSATAIVSGLHYVFRGLRQWLAGSVSASTA